MSSLAESSSIVRKVIEFSPPVKIAFNNNPRYQTGAYFMSLFGFSPWKAEHCVRSAAITGGLVSEFGLNASNSEAVVRASLIHDVGVTKLPIRLINSQDPLVSSDWNILKQHPLQGFRMVVQSDPQAADILVAHHGWQKDPYLRAGSRQPRRLEEVFQWLNALSDQVEALMSERPYKKERFSPEDVLNRLIGFFPEELAKVAIRWYKKLDEEGLTVFNRTAIC